MAKATYTLRVTLTGGPKPGEPVPVSPVVSCKIEIQADQTLEDLHRAIIGGFRRGDDCSLYGFRIGGGVLGRDALCYVLPSVREAADGLSEGPASGNVTTTEMGRLDLGVGQVLHYWYDPGEDWDYRIEVVVIGEAQTMTTYPRVVAATVEAPRRHLASDLDGVADPSDDWVAGVLAGHSEGGGIDRGTYPIGVNEVVSWARRSVAVELSVEVRGAASRRSYRVTTIADLIDGTSVISTYLVPGLYLGPWLGELRKPSEEQETVLSVEML